MTAIRLLAADTVQALSASHDTTRLRGLHELYSRFEQLLADWERELSPS